MQIFIITFLSIKSLQNWAKTKPLHSIVPKFTRKSSPKNIRKFFSWSYFERIFNINGIRHVISIILHRKNVNFGIFLLCGNFNFCKQKKYHPPKQAQFCSFVYFRVTSYSDDFISCLLFFLVLLLYFSVLYVDTIVYWEQTYLYYPNIPVFLHCVC